MTDSENNPERTSLLRTFIRHPNAANLLMVLILIAGIFALQRINTQFFPTIDSQRVTVSITWSGASAEDVDTNILSLVEPQVRFLEGVKEVTSAAREGGANISIEFLAGTPLDEAEADVKTALDGITTLPEASEEPEITAGRFYDSVSRISISGPFPEATLRAYAKRVRDALLQRGIDRVDFTGLRDEEVHIVLDEQKLIQLSLTVSDVTNAVQASTLDLPSGSLEGAIDKQVRVLASKTELENLRNIEIRSSSNGDKILLEDIATLQTAYEETAIRGLSGGTSAIQLNAQRLATSDTLEMAKTIEAYLAEITPTLPPNLKIEAQANRADALLERVLLLVKNGLGGLVLVVLILYIFLNGRIAFWVAAGIPVAMSATLALMYVSGQSINMLSLFALMMMLGIIVDDAIVVGEHTATRLEAGDSPMDAAEKGAGRMLVPVIAASLTTAAAFAPIFLIGDTIGKFMQVLPLVVIAVLIASLIECFFILPGHLAHAMKNAGVKPQWSHWRQLTVALIAAAILTVLASQSGSNLTQALTVIAQQDNQITWPSLGEIFSSWTNAPSWLSYLEAGDLFSTLVKAGFDTLQFIISPIFAAFDYTGSILFNIGALCLGWLFSALVSLLDWAVSNLKTLSNGIPAPAMTVILALLALGFGTASEALRMMTSRKQTNKPHKLRRVFDSGFLFTRDRCIAPLVRLAYRLRYITVAISVGCFMVLALGLIFSGKVGFTFFPSPESESITARVVFNAGISRDRAVSILERLEKSLDDVEQKLTDGEEPLIESQFTTYGQSGRTQGQNVASMRVRLTPSESRTVRTPDIVRTWTSSVPKIAGVKRFAISQQRGGPPGRDIDVRLQGNNADDLKLAALKLTPALSSIDGISGVSDDLDYGKPEVVIRLLPRGAALGFTPQSIGTQVRAAFEGTIARRVVRGDDEIALRISQTLSGEGRTALRDFQLLSPTGQRVSLSEIAELEETQGFASIQRLDGAITVSVTADINDAITSTQDVITQLETDGILQTLSSHYNLTYRFAGKEEERANSFKDLRVGVVVALAVIYIILAWIFGSYLRPIAVMLIIPFGLVGAVIGHYLLGFKLTILSLIGLLGLSGILVNDTIILVSRFDERLKEGQSVYEAASGASIDRFRAVMLTSLSTIGGLTPLLFEKSLQAQFLLPMAITIVFGLAFATLIVLFFVPATLGIGDDIKRTLGTLFSSTSARRLGKGEQAR